jgi:hypothetical protein
MQASELTFTGSDERIFRLGMYWRIGYGVLRILLAIIFLKVVNVPFNDVFRQIFGYELLEDPNDPLVSAISLFFRHPSNYYYLLCYCVFAVLGYGGHCALLTSLAALPMGISCQFGTHWTVRAL